MRFKGKGREGLHMIRASPDFIELCVPSQSGEVLKTGTLALPVVVCGDAALQFDVSRDLLAD